MTTTVSVQVKGAQLVRSGLQSLNREIPRIGARQIYGAMQRAQKRITTYPPPIPGSRYRRTGIYGRAWRIRRNPSGARRTAGYSLIGQARQRGRDYTRYVGGDAYGQRQASVHRGRWPVASDVLAEEVEKLPPEIERHISIAARRRGL